MGAILVVVWLLHRRDEGGLRLRAAGSAAVVGAAAALFGWAFLSAAWAGDPHTAVTSALRLGQGVLLVAVLADTLSSERALRLGTAAFVAGACLSAVLGLAGVGATSASADETATRIGGGLGDPNYLGAVLLAGLFFALALRLPMRRGYLRLLALAVPALLLVALVRTGSRGAVIAFAAAALAGLLLAGPLRRSVVALSATALAGGGAYLGFVASGSERRLTHFGGSGSGRTELWSVAARVFHNHPFGGVGSGNFSVVEPSYAATIHRNLSKPYLEVTTHEVVHNTYLHVLAELGIVGLVLLAAVVVGALAVGRRAATAFEELAEPRLAALAAGLVVGAVGLFVAFVFLSAQYEKQLWVTVGLLVAAGELAARRRAA
jgi:O-antigen ligase